MHTQRLQSIFFSLFKTMEEFALIDKSRSMTARARYDSALNANTALQNLLKREAGEKDAQQLMGSSNFYTLTVGRRDFTQSDADWVYLNGQGEYFSLRDVSLSEDIFVRDEVSVEETFKVGRIPLRPFTSSGQRTRMTKTSIGLYRINSSMEEWSEDLLERLKSERDRLGRPLRPQEVGPICDANPEWVNDDSGLIARCHRDTAGDKASYEVALISGDRRLANQMAETCNVTVKRLSPREFARTATDFGIQLEAGMNPYFLRKRGVRSDFIYIDTGAISAASVPLVEEAGITYHRQVHHTGWDGDRRFSKVTLTKLPKTRLLEEVHQPVRRPRIWRSGSRPHESAYSSHSSWKGSLRTSRSDQSWWRSGNPPPLTARSKQRLTAN
jgi:hypothetical protein